MCRAYQSKIFGHGEILRRANNILWFKKTTSKLCPIYAVIQSQRVLGVEKIPNMNLICDFRFLKIFKWANKINVCMCALKTCFVLFLWKNTDHSVYGQRNASFEKWWVMLLKFCEIDLLLDVKKQSIFKFQRIENIGQRLI